MFKNSSDAIENDCIPINSQSCLKQELNNLLDEHWVTLKVELNALESNILCDESLVLPRTKEFNLK